MFIVSYLISICEIYITKKNFVVWKPMLYTQTYKWVTTIFADAEINTKYMIMGKYFDGCEFCGGGGPCSVKGWWL